MANEEKVRELRPNSTTNSNPNPRNRRRNPNKAVDQASAGRNPEAVVKAGQAAGNSERRGPERTRRERSPEQSRGRAEERDLREKRGDKVSVNPKEREPRVKQASEAVRSENADSAGKANEGVSKSRNRRRRDNYRQRNEVAEGVVQSGEAVTEAKVEVSKGTFARSHGSSLKAVNTAQSNSNRNPVAAGDTSKNRSRRNEDSVFSKQIESMAQTPAVETFEDIRKDNERLEKEIYLDIASLNAIKI